MKKCLKYLAAAAVALFVVSCGQILIYQDQMPQFTPFADKARLVVIRINNGGYPSPNSYYTWIYVDKKNVSANVGGVVTSVPVEPGPHYVEIKPTGQTVNIPGVIKYNFQAGKVYYIKQAMLSVPYTLKALNFPITADEAMDLISKETCKFAVMDSTAVQKDQSDNDMKSTVENYTKWANDKPDDARKEADYPGY